MDCEVIQYISGLVCSANNLSITYGSNDCSPKRAWLLLSDVLADMVNVSTLSDIRTH